MGVWDLFPVCAGIYNFFDFVDVFHSTLSFFHFYICFQTLKMFTEPLAY